MEVGRRSLRVFVSGFRTHVVANTVCATGCVHTLRVALFSDTFFFTWRTDICRRVTPQIAHNVYFTSHWDRLTRTCAQCWQWWLIIEAQVASCKIDVIRHLTVVRLVCLPNSSNMVAERHGFRECISERTAKQIADAHVPQVVKRMIEVPKMVEQILDALVSDMVEQKLPETVSEERIQQRNVEQIVDGPVPQEVEELVEVFKVSSKDRVKQSFVEQIIETPAFSIAEKGVEVLVIQTHVKMPLVANTYVQHVVNCKHYLQYSKILRKMPTMITMATVKGMRTSVRRTTASSQTTTGTTRTTCSSPSTTPMTTLTHCTCTSTDAWRTCTETARTSLFRSLMMTPHTSWLKFWTHSHVHLYGHPWRTLLSSTTRSSWQTCAAPLQKRVRTPWIPSLLTQVMSPTSWPSESSTIHQSLSLSWSLPRTRTRMTWHSARCSQRHTEDKLTTAYQEACQSVSQSSSVMFDGSGQPDGERMVDQSEKSGVTFRVISAHSNFSEDI